MKKYIYLHTNPSAGPFFWFTMVGGDLGGVAITKLSKLYFIRRNKAKFISNHVSKSYAVFK